MINNIGNGVFDRVLNISNKNLVKLKNAYSKISPKTKVKSLGCVNTYKRRGRYKRTY